MANDQDKRDIYQEIATEEGLPRKFVKGMAFGFLYSNNNRSLNLKDGGTLDEQKAVIIKGLRRFKELFPEKWAEGLAAYEA